MTHPAPASTYKPRNPKKVWLITAAIVAAFIVTLAAASAAQSQTPRQPKPPTCIDDTPLNPADRDMGNKGRCWRTKTDAPKHLRGCLREDRDKDGNSKWGATDENGNPYWNPQIVLVSAAGKQPNGDRRYCAGVNFCRKPVPNGYRYTAANCRNQ